MLGTIVMNSFKDVLDFLEYKDYGNLKKTMILLGISTDDLISNENLTSLKRLFSLKVYLEKIKFKNGKSEFCRKEAQGTLEAKFLENGIDIDTMFQDRLTSLTQN